MNPDICDWYCFSDVKTETQQSRKEEPLISSSSNCKINANKSALRLRQPVGQETKEEERSTSVADFPTITIATADNTPVRIVKFIFGRILLVHLRSWILIANTIVRIVKFIFVRMLLVHLRSWISIAIGWQNSEWYCFKAVGPSAL